VGLVRGPLSFVSTTEELLGRKGSGLENIDYGRRDPPHLSVRRKLALTLSTSSGRSSGLGPRSLFVLFVSI
jgi:hypothetical protein